MKNIKIYIVSGFLGAGKTTFINRMLCTLKEKAAVIENEFGDVSVDTTLIEKDIPVKELRSGCICCSLKGDLSKSIVNVSESYDPDVIIIEPSGVGKLSEVEKAVSEAVSDRYSFTLLKKITLVESPSYMEIKNDYGEFYKDQILNADTVILNLTDGMSEKETEEIISDIRQMGYSSSMFVSEITGMDDSETDEILKGHILPERRTKKTSEKASEIRDVHPSDKCHTSHDVFRTFTLKSCLKKLSVKDIDEAGVKLNKLFSAFSDKSSRILRIKGYISDTSGKKILVNMTGANSEIRYAEKSEKNSSLSDVLIVIGSGIKKEEIERFLLRYDRKLTFRRFTHNDDGL